MTFDLLIDQIENGKTFEQICKERNVDLVECIENQVYEDEDLYEFLESIGAKIEDYGVDYAVITTINGNVYEIPYKDKKNRHGDDLPDETLLFFEPDKIYDVTKDYITDDKC